MLANLHVLVGKTFAIAIHAIKSLQSPVVVDNGSIKITESEVVVGEITEDIEGEDRISNQAAFNRRITAKMVLHSKSIVIQ